MSDVSIPGEHVHPPGAVDRTGADRAAIYDVSVRDDVHFLHKHAIGLWGVLFLTVTRAAPISAMLFTPRFPSATETGLRLPPGSPSPRSS